MIEILFSDSAAGSMKCARGYGRGPFPGGTMGIILDGDATPAERAEALARAEEQERKKWEAAVPFDAAGQDILGFSLGLSAGDIRGDFWEGRREVLDRLSPYPMAEKQEAIRSSIHRGKETVAAFLDRVKGGEALRVWYGGQPEDLCGLCWLMAELENASWQGELWLVRLPEWEAGEGESLVRLSSWGDIGPGQWGGYLYRQEKAPALLPRALAREWRRLREENAPLRAVISGQVCSVGEDFYDPFLLAELAAMPEEFLGGALIGQTLGKHPLGMGDGWLALRIEELERQGVLETVRPAPEDQPGYQKVLRKRRN